MSMRALTVAAGLLVAFSIFGDAVVVAARCLAAEDAATVDGLEIVDVEGQPLAANVTRLITALDFPCMSSRRVGQGRVYVRMGEVKAIDFETWCRGLAKGQSYVSDGFAHAIDFRVNQQRPGEDDLALASPGKVMVTAKVAFAPETPRAVAYGLQVPPLGRRMSGDTVQLHAPRNQDWVAGGKRKIEIVVNGKAVASQEIEADGKLHEIRYEVAIGKSSWVALRQFPQLHTNPVNVIVEGKPIRASKRSAIWCAEAIKLLWENRHTRIAVDERPAAKAAYDRAIATYRRIASETKP